MLLVCINSSMALRRMFNGFEMISVALPCDLHGFAMNISCLFNDISFVLH